MIPASKPCEHHSRALALHWYMHFLVWMHSSPKGYKKDLKLFFINYKPHYYIVKYILILDTLWTRIFIFIDLLVNHGGWRDIEFWNNMAVQQIPRVLLLHRRWKYISKSRDDHWRYQLRHRSKRSYDLKSEEASNYSL